MDYVNSATNIVNNMFLSLGNDAKLKVTPEVMRQKATAVDQHITKIQNEFESIRLLIDRTKGYWIGEAGDAHRKKYKEYDPDIEQILKRLREHVRDLNQMAGVYADTEHEVREIAESLPADVIQ
ncbi:MAG: WXG100 family type VII secretion target [Lachnospiraceae bacterium]|nr:WXG100 family type VII secretion target [Lachnospiraceae bacterium]